MKCPKTLKWMKNLMLIQISMFMFGCAIFGIARFCFVTHFINELTINQVWLIIIRQ